MTDRRIQAAEQLRAALQMFAATVPAEMAIQIPCVFEPWQADKDYAAGDRLTFGENGVGDPQLYRVVQAHISQDLWLPGTVPSLYTAIGLDREGYPIWAAPTGAHDAYDKGDVVDYNGVLYESLIDGNTVVPGTDDRYWRAL